MILLSLLIFVYPLRVQFPDFRFHLTMTSFPEPLVFRVEDDSDHYLILGPIDDNTFGSVFYCNGTDSQVVALRHLNDRTLLIEVLNENILGFKNHLLLLQKDAEGQIVGLNLLEPKSKKFTPFERDFVANQMNRDLPGFLAMNILGAVCGTTK